MESIEKNKEPTTAQYEAMQSGHKAVLNQKILDDGTLIYQYTERQGGDDKWGDYVGTIAIDSNGNTLDWDESYNSYIQGWEKNGFTPDSE